MPATPPNEVLAALGAHFTGDVALAAAIGNFPAPDNRPKIVYDEVPDAGPYPILVYRDDEWEKRGTDAEGWDGGIVPITLELVGPDPEALADIRRLIDQKEVFSDLGAGPLDSTHYVATIFARRSAWVRVPLHDRKDPATGRPVTLWSSTWELRCGRRQTVT